VRLLPPSRREAKEGKRREGDERAVVGGWKLLLEEEEAGDEKEGMDGIGLILLPGTTMKASLPPMRLITSSMQTKAIEQPWRRCRRMLHSSLL